MRQKSGKKILHYAAYALMLLLLLAGVFAAGSVRGFFGESPQTSTPLTAEEVSGNVSLTRLGVSFYVREDTALRVGDRIATAKMADLLITDGERDYRLSEETEVLITDGHMEVLSGSLTVLEGGKAKSLAAGERVSYLEKTVFLAETEESSPVASGPEEQTSAALKEKDDREETAAGSAASQTESPAAEETASAEEQPEQITNFSKPAGSAAEAETSAAKPAKPAEEITTAQEKTTAPAETAAQEKTTAQAQTESAAETSPENAVTCVVEIRCDTVLQNMDLLSAEKRSVIPSDGVMLAGASVTLSEGETAYDALRRVSGQYGIMVEAAYTPIYGSCYIEGINNLYEFDCGSESGWIYRVNNVTMGTGCSSYVVQEGDVISFLYTCKGLGADLP